MRESNNVQMLISQVDPGLAEPGRTANEVVFLLKNKKRNSAVPCSAGDGARSASVDFFFVLRLLGAGGGVLRLRNDAQRLSGRRRHLDVVFAAAVVAVVVVVVGGVVVVVVVVQHGRDEGGG